MKQYQKIGVVFLSFLVFTVSSTVYHFILIDIFHELKCTDTKQVIESENTIGFYCRESKDIADFQVRYRNFRIIISPITGFLRQQLFIKSLPVSTYSMNKYLVELANNSFCDVYIHIFPFHYFY